MLMVDNKSRAAYKNIRVKRQNGFSVVEMIIAVVVISLLLTAGLFVYKKVNNNPSDDSGSTKEEKWPSATAKYITAVPLDLTQIEAISKYRSCAGHVRTGYDFDRILNPDCSMKHYIYPTEPFQATTDKVKVFAPFDGEVVRLTLEQDEPAGKRPNNGNGIFMTNSVDPNAVFGFGHIYFVKDFKVGDKVQAGELLGYAALRGENGKDYDFDIDLDSIGAFEAVNGQEVLGSIFDHMTDSVLAEFAKYGVTPENTKVSLEYREAHPCNYVGENKEYSLACVAYGSDSHDNDCWVKLIH